MHLLARYASAAGAPLARTRVAGAAPATCLARTATTTYRGDRMGTHCWVLALLTGASFALTFLLAATVAVRLTLFAPALGVGQGTLPRLTTIGLQQLCDVDQSNVPDHFLVFRNATRAGAPFASARISFAAIATLFAISAGTILSRSDWTFAFQTALRFGFCVIDTFMVIRLNDQSRQYKHQR